VRYRPHIPPAPARNARLSSYVPAMMLRYIERISERRASRVAERLRARGGRDMGERLAEVLEQLVVRLLGVGPVRTSGKVQSSGKVLGATRTPQLVAGTREQQRATHTYCETSRSSPWQKGSVGMGIERAR
jgi:hypothetical protein